LSVSIDWLEGAQPSLGYYISAIVSILAADNTYAATRLRRVASDRRARIILDDEAVDVRFDGEDLRVEPARSGQNVDGMGQTDRRTVLDLLSGHLEASTAILDGLIIVEGSPDAVVAMVHIIEIVLDAAPRSPALQQLASQFIRDSSARPTVPRSAHPPILLTAWYPAARPPAEDGILASLDLIPDPRG
jgi:hypothetical protein